MQKSKYLTIQWKEKLYLVPIVELSYELAKSENGYDLKPAQAVGEDWGE